MPHQFNERVFSTLETTSALLSSYLRLVGVELALKNSDPANWGLGHQIDLMLAAVNVPALQALGQKLRATLVTLWCEDRGGGAVHVSARSYPTMRYLRHASDFGAADASSDADLEAIKAVVDDLVAELKHQGILQ